MVISFKCLEFILWVGTAQIRFNDIIAPLHTVFVSMIVYVCVHVKTFFVAHQLGVMTLFCDKVLIGLLVILPRIIPLAHTLRDE